jgi:hypothetical protein
MNPEAKKAKSAGADKYFNNTGTFTQLQKGQ